MRKLFLPLLAVFLLAGCVSTQTAQREEPTPWKWPQIEQHVERYVELYGEPHLYVIGRNLVDDQEYLSLYWYIGDRWYQVQIFRADREWTVTIDDLARSML
jgi:outer membrane biogenesis lipoprotein LolB